MDKIVIKELIDSGYVPHVSSGKFALSGVGMCLREKYFALWKQYKKEWEAKNFRIFAVGDFVHRQAVSALISGAPAMGYEVMAAEINVADHELFSGRIDCILSKMDTGDKIIVDFKSCGKWVFNKVKEGDVSQTYNDQLNMYMYLFGIHKAYLLFVCKDNSEFMEHEVVYDEARAKQVEKEIQDFYNNYVYLGKMPPKCNGGEWGCEICEVKGSISKKEVYTPKNFDIMDAQQEIEDHITKGGTYKDLYNGI